MSSVTMFTAEEARAIAEKRTIPQFLGLQVLIVGLYFLGHPWPGDRFVVQAWWTLFAAYFFFCWTSCFHETAHQTLCRSAAVNIWLGRSLGIMMFVPYTAYRETHIRHHAYLNRPNDWELWPYSDPTTSRTFRRVFVWFDLLFGVVTAPYIFGRIYFHKNPRIKSPEVRKAIRNEYLVILFFWSVVWGTIAYCGAWMGYLKVLVIPTIISGIIQTGRKLTEHLGMASYDPLLGTRTVMGKNWLSRLGTFLNFDIFLHGPHHRHPRMAHNRLAEKMRAYMSKRPETHYPVYSSYWRATRAMLPALLRNPGVGMNVGAPPPGKVKNDHVQNFVGDVTEEVLA